MIDAVRVLHTHGVIAAIDVAFENKKAPPRRPMIDAESVCGTPTGQLPQTCGVRKKRFVFTKMADDRCRVRVLHTHGAVATKHVAAESNETSSRWSMIDAESACCTHTAQLPQNMWRRKEGHVLTKMADDRCTVRVLHTHGAVAAKHVASE